MHPELNIVTQSLSTPLSYTVGGAQQQTTMDGSVTCRIRYSQGQRIQNTASAGDPNSHHPRLLCQHLSLSSQVWLHEMPL